MKVTILGSGTSTGVPEIGCQCEVCRSHDARDARLRTSALVETDDTRILIDCGPDFRAQVMHLPFLPIDGVLITHEHYDHVGGLDDLRPFCRFQEVPVYAEKLVAEHLRNRMPYCFAEHKYPGVPRIRLEEIKPDVPFHVQSVEVMPIRVMHGQLPIVGFRIKNMVYITDMKTIPEEEIHQLDGVECLIVNALRIEPHWTHQSLSEALAFIERVRPRVAYLIHMSHGMGLHAQVDASLPTHVHLAYDGLTIHC